MTDFTNSDKDMKTSHVDHVDLVDDDGVKRIIMYDENECVTGEMTLSGSAVELYIEIVSYLLMTR